MRYYYLKTNACDSENLSADLRYVLDAMDGYTHLNSSAFLPKHRAIAEELCRRGAAFRCARGFRGTSPGPIRGAYWAITGFCNLRCTHCYMSSPVNHPKPPELKRLMTLADRLASGGAVELILTGGEVFSYQQLPELLDYLEESGFYVSNILTNATLVTESTPALFTDRDMFPRFHVSFDGVGHHSRFRGVMDAEERTLRGIRILKDAGFHVGVNTSIDAANLTSLPATYECMKELGVDEWGVARPLRFGCAKGMSIPSTDAFAAVCTDLQERWLADGRPMTLGLEGLYSYRPGAVRTIRPFDGNQPSCWECRDYPYLSDKGLLMPCSAYTDSPVSDSFPDLSAMEFEDAWNSEFLQKVMSITPEDVMAHSPECRTCEYLSECKTGCRASALINAGSVYAADPYNCEILKRQMQKQYYQREKEHGE